MIEIDKISYKEISDKLGISVYDIMNEYLCWSS